MQQEEIGQLKMQIDTLETDLADVQQTLEIQKSQVIRVTSVYPTRSSSVY